MSLADRLGVDPGRIVTPSQLDVLAALMRVFERDGRATLRGVAAEAGRSVSTTKKSLVRLRARGLVAWEDRQQGTLRPLVQVISNPGQTLEVA